MGVGQVHYLCDACWKQIQFLTTPWCRICGLPFNFYGGDAPRRSFVCVECQKKPPLYNKLRTIAFYEPTLREAIHQRKATPDEIARADEACRTSSTVSAITPDVEALSQ